MTEAEADGSVSDGDSDGSDSSDTMWTRNLCLETGKLKVEEDYHAGAHRQPLRRQSPRNHLAEV